MTTTNGMSPPPAALETPPDDDNAAALEAIEAEAKRAGVRLPRRTESRESYLLTIARNRGVIPQDAHVANPAATVKELLDRAATDELYGSSPAGRAVVIGAAIWSRCRPELAHVGELRPSGRRGAHVATAALVHELQQDPARAQRLSPAESELLRCYVTDELHQAVDELGQTINAALERVREAAKAELARPLYSDLVPREPAPPEEAAFSFVDQRGLPPGEHPGDVQLANVGRTEPISIPTPAHLRGPRSW